jgi:glycosyltransferase involved in cell wall biosynthesis
MKKILVIHNRYLEKGGEDIAVNHEVELLKDKFNVKELYFDNKINNYLSQAFYFLINKNIKSISRLRNILNDYEPDLVYVHNTWFKASLGIFQELEKHNQNTVIKLHNFRYLCTNSLSIKNHLNGKRTCPACGMNKGKKVFNKYFQNSYLKSLLVIYYGKKYFKIISSSKFKILVLTNFHKNYFIDKNISTNVSVLNNFVSIIEEQEKDFDDYMVYAGRISKEKGVKELIDAFKKAKLENIHLKIIGNGPQLQNLIDLHKSDKNIIFYGSLSNQETMKIIAKANCIVTATKLWEGQPTLLCEASFFGKPSIFPNTGGISEFFPKNYGLMFEQNNYSDLITKLKLVENKDLMRKIGEKNKTYIQDYLNKIKILDKFEKSVFE